MPSLLSLCNLNDQPHRGPRMCVSTIGGAVFSSKTHVGDGHARTVLNDDQQHH